MKKLLTLTILSLILFGGYASARNIYDSTGRHLIYDGTIRGRQRAAAAAKLKNQKIQAAAAAKINYEDDENDSGCRRNIKFNYIQGKSAFTPNLPDANLKANYLERKK